MLRLGAIALIVAAAIVLFVAVAIAIALAAIIIALFNAHRCAPSPPTVIRICSNGGVGNSLAPAAAAWRGQRQLDAGNSSLAPVAVAWRQQRR